MPKISLKPGSKGLVQESGNVVAGEAIGTVALHTMGGNGETIKTNGALIRRVDAGGTARTGVIMELGNTDGQLCIVVNTGGELLTMAAASSSNVTTGTGCKIATGTGVIFCYDSTIADWHPLYSVDT